MVVADAPDEPAWYQALEELTPRLHAWTQLRLRNETDATKEDFVQEVLFRAVASHSRFAGGNVAAWVFQIAKHVLLESLRQKRRDARMQRVDGHTSRFAALHEFPAQVTSMWRRAAKRDDCRELLAFVAELDPIDQRLVLLCGLEGVSVRDAAIQVGLGEAACSKRWYRLRQRLRGAFGEQNS
ncbi:MAG: RNA polymerase sigma factor [Planctomycetes bacterium]|nr:RNA polymerase sigma factor [Planctomycetota bacterium]